MKIFAVPVPLRTDLRDGSILEEAVLTAMQHTRVNANFSIVD